MKMGTFFKTILLAAAVIVSANGCGAHHPYFDLSQKEYVIKAGSLAVISGDKAPASIGLAALLTNELQNRSTFRILSQQEISKRFPDYPDNILEIKNDKTAMKLLHEKLKTDYLFVVWGKFLDKTVTTTTYMSVFFIGLGKLEADINGRLIHCPDETEIGITDFRASRSGGITTVDAVKSDNEIAGKMLQSSAVSIVDDILDITKAAKTSR